jgi:hypothetical protein
LTGQQFFFVCVFVCLCRAVRSDSKWATMPWDGMRRPKKWARLANNVKDDSEQELWLIRVPANVCLFVCLFWYRCMLNVNNNQVFVFISI